MSDEAGPFSDQGEYLPTVAEAYDFPATAETRRRIVFASTARSGSHFICQSLAATGAVGLPLEYFHPARFAAWQARAGGGDASATVALLLRRRTGSNGCFAVKAHWNQLALAAESGALAALTPSDWVRILRRDLVAQAVSWHIAAATHEFVAGQPAPNPRAPVYDFAAIRSLLHVIVAQNHAWDAFFRRIGVTPLVVTYEDFMTSPASAAQQVLRGLGLAPVQPGPGRLPPLPERQSSPMKDDWVAAFARDLRAATRQPGMVPDPETVAAASGMLGGRA